MSASPSSAGSGDLSSRRRLERANADEQRRCLRLAMVEIAGESGFGAATVTALIRHAGVTRKTFANLYSDREDLLRAAFDECSAKTLEIVSLESSRPRERSLRIAALTGGLCRCAREQHGMIGLCTIEIAGVPGGAQRLQTLMDAYGALLQDALSRDGEEVMSSMLARSLACAMHRTIDGCVNAERSGELGGLAGELAQWLCSYHPRPPLQEAGRPPREIAARLVGGRAPGTLALALDIPGMDGLAYSPVARDHIDRERVLDAVVKLTEVHGHRAVTVSMLAERAGISESLFLHHFDGKAGAVTAAVEHGHLKGEAMVRLARDGTEDWYAGVRHATRVLAVFLASEPGFTRLAVIEAPLLGRAGAARAREQVATYAHLLLAGAPWSRRGSSVTPKAVVRALFELCLNRSAPDGGLDIAHLVADAEYLVLAPFLGEIGAVRAVAGAGPEN